MDIDKIDLSAVENGLIALKIIKKKLRNLKQKY